MSGERPTAEPAEVAARLVAAIGDEQLAGGPVRVRVRVGEVDYTVSVTRSAAPQRAAAAEDDDLPDAIRGAVRAVKLVYRIIRDLRAAAGGRDRRVLSKEIVAEDRRRRGLDVMSIHTVGHAITVLKRAGAITKMRRLGWRLATPSDSDKPNAGEGEPTALAVPSSALSAEAEREASQNEPGGVNSDKCTECHVN